MYEAEARCGCSSPSHRSHSPHSLKGIVYGSIIEPLKGETRSLDCSSYAKAVLEGTVIAVVCSLQPGTKVSLALRQRNIPEIKQKSITKTEYSTRLLPNPDSEKQSSPQFGLA